MDEHFKQLQHYIKQHLDQGVDENHIRQTLHQHNWDPTMVDQAFSSLSSQHAPAHHEAHPHPDQPASHHEPTHHEGATHVPKKYTVRRAIVDTFKAMGANLSTLFINVLIGLATSVIAFAIAAFIYAAVIEEHTSVLFGSALSLIFYMMLSVLLFVAFYIVVEAYLICLMSIPLLAGREGRKVSMGASFNETFAKLWRVIRANALFVSIAYLPIVMAFVVLIAVVSTRASYSTGSMLLFPVLLLAGVAWIYIAIIRYILMPYVALFEPQLTVRETMKRSQHLLTKGGQWFILKGFLFILAIVILMSAVTGKTFDELTESNNLLVNLVFLFITIVINGVLVMLYHNRKHIRG